MSAKRVMTRVLRNPASMYNTLPVASEWSMYECCLGVHGAMRLRRGTKHGTVTARRRLDRAIVAAATREGDENVG